jgi:hypothetical protein
MNPRRILMIQLFSNGDCLIATTVARQIRHDFPNAHVTWAVATSCQSMLFQNPDIDQVRLVELDPAENKEKAYERFLKQAQAEQAAGQYDQIIVPQIIGDNYALYDGCIRTSIYRNYGRPITVDHTPVLVLSPEEDQRAQLFYEEHKLGAYKHIILFECAPLSGQVAFSVDYLRAFAAAIENKSIAIVFSSGKKIPIEAPHVFNGSVLTIRETVAFAKKCDLLIGCSSGITWAVTSLKEHKIPMVQVLDKQAYYYNPPSVAFERLHESADHIIERYDVDAYTLADCVHVIYMQGVDQARRLFHQPAVKNFRIFRGIIFRFLRAGKWKLLRLFMQQNIRIHGWNLSMLRMITLGVVVDPLLAVFRKKQD